jgi:serine/threonine-protein phosphatase 2A activator
MRCVICCEYVGLILNCIKQLSPSLHSEIPGLSQEAAPEISVYFNEAWGNRSRIDYGSGMELNFLCWLYVLI